MWWWTGCWRGDSFDETQRTQAGRPGVVGRRRQGHRPGRRRRRADGGGLHRAARVGHIGRVDRRRDRRSRSAGSKDDPGGFQGPRAELEVRRVSRPGSDRKRAPRRSVDCAAARNRHLPWRSRPRLGPHPVETPRDQHIRRSRLRRSQLATGAALPAGGDGRRCDDRSARAAAVGLSPGLRRGSGRPDGRRRGAGLDVDSVLLPSRRLDEHGGPEVHARRRRDSVQFPDRLPGPHGREETALADLRRHAAAQPSRGQR